MKKEIWLKSSKGFKISCLLNQPGEDSKLLMILLHGFTSSKKSPTYINLTRELSKHNISTLAMDFFGHGDSEGDFADLTVDECVDDVLKAIEFGKKLGFEKMGLFGSSFGGLVALLTAAGVGRKNISLVALKSPVSNAVESWKKNFGPGGIEKWKTNGYILTRHWSGDRCRLNYSFFESLEKHDAYKIAEKIEAPVFIVHGDEDLVVPINQSTELVKHLKGEKELKVVPGANHNYSNIEHFNQMISLIANWVKGFA